MSKQLYPNQQQRAMESFKTLIAIMDRLREECPWDRKQTHESLRELLIEETYETIDAIDRKDWQELKAELGDLLLHVVFHAKIASETEEFFLHEVCESINEKLIRRHPHIFGDAQVKNEAEVLQNWERIKLAEKKTLTGKQGSVLSGVPKALPSLVQAQRIQEKAAGVGFDFPQTVDAWAKLKEEIQELEQASLLQEAAQQDTDALEAEFGDVLFALVNTARFARIVPENALRRANQKFIRRFQFIEQKLIELGLQIGEVELAEMDRHWDEAKRLEKQGLLK